MQKADRPSRTTGLMQKKRNLLQKVTIDENIICCVSTLSDNVLRGITLPDVLTAGLGIKYYEV